MLGGEVGVKVWNLYTGPVVVVRGGDKNVLRYVCMCFVRWDSDMNRMCYLI